jgi:hypothetical protein
MRDSRRNRRFAQISVVRGREAELIPPTAAQDEHVISFGSGPDALRPLRDFPNSQHIHLVDSMVGWGDSPAVVLSEFITRLKGLGARAQVEVLEAGFSILDAEILSDRNRFWKLLATQPDMTLHPFTVRVSWVSSTEGRQSKIISLHPAHYQVPASVGAVLSSIPTGEKIGGVLVSGAPIPIGEAGEVVNRRLKPGAIYVTEIYRTPKGEYFIPAEADWVEHLAAMHWRKQLVPPDSAEESSRTHMLNSATTLLFTKP